MPRHRSLFVAALLAITPALTLAQSSAQSAAPSAAPSSAQPAAAAATGSLEVVPSAGGAGYTAVGDTVPLGFLVTNTGTRTLSKVGVQATTNGDTVPVACRDAVLLPGAQTACNATRTIAAGDVAQHKLDVVARAAGSTSSKAKVTSPQATLVVAAVPGQESVPLLPTPLAIVTGRPSALDPTYRFGTNITRTDETPANWTVAGTDSSGATTCRPDSTPTTAPNTPGVLCLGTGTSVPGQSLPVLHIAVPTPTLQLPVQCALEVNQDPNAYNFFPDYTSNLPCSFRAQVSLDGQSWQSLGSVFTSRPGNPGQPGTTPCETHPAAWDIDYPKSKNTCMTFGSLTLTVPSASQFLRILQTNTAANTKYNAAAPPGSQGKYHDTECFWASATSVVHETPGPAQCASPAMQVSVQPTARVQGNVIVSRVVYQPPGSGSSQTFTTAAGATTDTQISLGKEDSSITATSTSLGVDAALSAGASWAKLNLSTSNTWDSSTQQVATTTNTQTNATTISTSFSSSIQPPPWSRASNPAAAPWENDYFDLLIRPQFAVWDFSSCTEGVASIQPNGSLACTSGVTVPRTGVVPTGVSGHQQVTVRDLMSCVAGDEEFVLSGGVAISQAECRSIVAQDPFAATALGIVPTPVGQSPGQAVNPAALLGSAAAAPVATNALPPGATNNQTFDESKASTKSFEASSSMQTEVTSVETNTVSVGLSTDISIGPLFSFSASASFNYGQTSTEGLSLLQSYSGGKSFTQSQQFTTDVTLNDPDVTLTYTEYLDPRYSTLMFQSGQPGVPRTPSVTAVSPVALTGATALAKGKRLAQGATIAVSALPLPITTGQRLRLPSGQVLRAASPAAVGARKVKVGKATIRAAVPKGAKIGLVGGLKITGAGLANGPIRIRLCSSPAGVPRCRDALRLTTRISYGGRLLYASAQQPPRTAVGVSAQTQSGSSPGTGYAYTIR